MAVLVTNDDLGALEFLDGVRTSIKGYWNEASSLSRDELEAYRETWGRNRRSLKRLRIRQEKVRRKEDAILKEGNDVLTARFAEAIQDVLGKHGPMRSAAIHQSVGDGFPHLCNNRGMKRSYSVWKRDLRNGIEKLEGEGSVLRIPSPPWERKGIYILRQSFPAIARWVDRGGCVEIVEKDGAGFLARALDSSGPEFEDDRPSTLAEATAALESGLTARFSQQEIDLE